MAGGVLGDDAREMSPMPMLVVARHLPLRQRIKAKVPTQGPEPIYRGGDTRVDQRNLYALALGDLMGV